MYCNHNPTSDQYTATPDKYPQKRFKPKPCKRCGHEFEPVAPSHSHCSDVCREESHTNRYLMRTYGIGIDRYKELLASQNNKCAICKGEGFVMDEKRHKVKLVVDHCHATGEVRGLLCHNCNRALGLFGDNTESLKEATKYLEGATTIPTGSTP